MISLSRSPASTLNLHRVAWLMTGACCLLAILVACLPLEVSIASVFVFAGPHNWMEARLLLDRMPHRWGKLRAYFTLSLMGTVVLAASFVGLVLVSQGTFVSFRISSDLLSLWQSAFIAWVVILALLRCRETAGRNWDAVIPIGLVLAAGSWLAPTYFNLGLVYLHPLIAWGFVLTEIARRHPEWSGAFRQLACILLVSALFLLVMMKGDLMTSPSTEVTRQIVHHSGADLLPNVSQHLLVAIHTYLELVHYVIWLVVLPRLTLRTHVWEIASIPLMKSRVWKKLIPAGLLLGVLSVVVLWAAFIVDYAVTRDIYFTLAITHVLAEIPFLIRRL